MAIDTQTTTNRALLIFRVLTGLAILGSIVWQVSDRIANGLFRPEEYFSYVTIQSSLLAGLCMLAGAQQLITNKPESLKFTLTRLSVTGYAVIVAVVYNLLLRGVAGDVRDAGYDWPVLPNEILHVWGPVLIVVDWLLTNKGAQVKIKQTAWVLAYPVLWIGFTVTRGYASGWWPYPFLDPTKPAGVAGMLTYLAIIVVFLAITSLVMVGLSKLIHRRG
jgi:hypothetical protein